MSNSSFKERTRTRVLMACTSCRSRKVRPTDSLRSATLTLESLLSPAKEAPGGDEVFLYDPYPTNSPSTSPSPSPAPNHTDFRFPQSESRRYPANRESYSQSPSVGHLNDSVRGVWGHSSTNSPSDKDLDKGQISSGYGYTGYPDFSQARGNVPHSSSNYASSGTTYGGNGYPGNSTYPTGNRMPVQNPSHSSVSQNYGYSATAGNVGGAWSGRSVLINLLSPPSRNFITFLGLTNTEDDNEVISEE
ncbi:hypothetical protein L218DRAFT_947468 [Marasmius fiardii PR-910]|nr:hypothetical protein L218DRAFT_947468 [Marasmius fiardii PR-910]